MCVKKKSIKYCNLQYLMDYLFKMSYPNIIQQINSKLPLSGGTLTGAINFANNTWNIVGDDAYFGDCNVAGCVGVKGKNGETGVNFISKDGTTSSKLCISGSNLTINGNTIITSAGGEVKSQIYTTGNIPYELRHLTAANADTTRDTATYQMLCVGLDKTGKRGGGVEVCYNTDGSRTLQFTQRNRADSGYNSLALREFADGTVYAQVNSQRVVAIDAQSTGATGYRKYADGFRIQWGRLNVNECVKTTVTLPIAFSNANYHVDVCNASGKTVGDTEGVMTVCDYTTTTFNISTGYINPNTSAAVWFACGY